MLTPQLNFWKWKLTDGLYDKNDDNVQHIQFSMLLQGNLWMKYKYIAEKKKKT